MDPFSLLSPEAMEELFVLHPWFFLLWSAITFCLGVIVGWNAGKRFAGIPTFYDLTKRQRALLSNLRHDKQTVVCDGEVLELERQGLITEHMGFDVLPKSTHTFSLTAKGNRMLNFHPIGRRISARSRR